MRIVLPPTAFDDKSLDTAIHLAASAGVEVGLEIFPSDTYFSVSRADQFEGFAAQLRRHGIRADCVHAPFGTELDISSPNSTVRRAAISRIRETIAACRALGGDVVVMHPGDTVGEGSEEERTARACEMMPQLVPNAEAAGIMLAVENMPPGYVGARVAPLLEIVHAAGSPSVGVCFDTGHANLLPAFESLVPAGPHLVWIHAHDNHGREDEHLPPGDGTIDWRRLMAELQSVDYEYPIALECRPHSGQTCREMVDRFLGLASSGT